MTSNIARNIIRTAVPSIVGAVAALITKIAVHLTPSETAIIFPIATTAYYSAIRFLEERYPQFGWLLGSFPANHTIVINNVSAANTAPVADATVPPTTN